MNDFAARSAQSAYHQQQAGAWTRIDMLLALYAKANELLRELCEAGERLPAQQLRLVRVLLGIRQGLDHEMGGELAANIDRLCEYAQHQVVDGAPAGLASAAKVLETLEQAFLAIRDQAVELEQAGEIPPPVQETSWQRLA